MVLSLLDWNVWVFNEDLEGVLAFITAENADVVCLQEVSVPLLEKLTRETPYPFLFKARDAYHKRDGDRNPSFLVIMARHRVVGADAIVFKRQKKRILLARLLGIEEGIEFQYADILCGEKRVRFFNVHLECVAGPKRRVAQFDEVTRLFQYGANIVCGDLNILRVWYTFFFRLVLGSWDELWEREHDFFARVFGKHALSNIFEGAVTHDFTGTQLDYILVPKATRVEEKVLFEDTFGSDHRPMLVRLSV